jgi:hypothetical protein
VADTIASRSRAGISATRPKSSSTSLPACGPSVTFSRLPGCGSPWKKPAPWRSDMNILVSTIMQAQEYE